MLKLSLRTGPSALSDIDWRPWAIEDEIAPTHDPEGKKLTLAALRRWRDERPYRLGLVCVNLQKGTYEPAALKAKIRPRCEAMHKMHWCDEKERTLYGNSRTGEPARSG